MDARVKFVLVVAFILTCSLTPPGAWAVYIILLALLFSVELLSELGIPYYIKRALLAIPFILAALPILFTTKGIPLLSLPLADWMLTISTEGIIRFTSITIKSWISVQAAILLAACTTFPDLLLAMRAVKVPRLLVAIFSLMWRYLFVMADEALRLMRARASRSSQSLQAGFKTGRNVVWRSRIAGGMAGNLFLRAIERSDRIYMAMVSRGYDGEVRSTPLPPLHRQQKILLAVGLVMLIFLVGISFFLSG